MRHDYSEIKKCCKCHKEYPATEEFFYKNAGELKWLRPYCKSCMNIASTTYRKNREIEYDIIYNSINRDGLLKQCHQCKKEFPATLEYFFKATTGEYGLRSICKNCFTKNSKKLKQTPKHRAKASETGRKWYQANKEKVSERYKKYYQDNLEYHYERAKKYAQNNRHIIRLQDKRRREDPQFRLSSNISRAMRDSLINGKGGRHWESLVGYTLKELVKHIEKQFKPGMSWDNYGDWHLDHVIAKIHFNFTSYKDIDFKRCWALENLQPMWAKDNMVKHAKLDAPFQPALAFG